MTAPRARAFIQPQGDAAETSGQRKRYRAPTGKNGELVVAYMRQFPPGTGIPIAKVMRDVFGVKAKGDQKNRLYHALRNGLVTIDRRVPRHHLLYLGDIALPPLDPERMREMERAALRRRERRYQADQDRGFIPLQRVVNAAVAAPIRCRGPRSVFDLGREAA